MTGNISRLPDTAPVVYQAYFDGFSSGYNLGKQGKSDYFGESKRETRYQYVLEYCESNPQKLIVDGLNQLILRYD